MISDYSWNIGNWIPRRLPFKRRTDIAIAWLKALLSPLQEKADEFSTACTDWDYRVMYSSQQKVFAALLNKQFDSTSKRIRVETVSDLISPVVLYHDTELPEASVLYHDSETEPEPVIINHDSEDAAAVDFRVFVPTSLSGIEDRIMAWVNQYKLADKQYEIIYI